MAGPRGIAVMAAIAAAVAVSQAFGRFSYSVLLTDIRADLGLSNSMAGALGSANLAAYLVGSLVVSLIIGRVGLSSVAKLGLVAVTGGLALLAWSPNVAVLTTALLVTGFMAAGVWVTAPALAVAELGSERKGAAIGVTSVGVGAGMMLSSWLDTFMDWRAVYLTEFLIAVAAVTVLMLFVRGTSRPRAQQIGLGAIRSIPGWRPLLIAYGLFGCGMSTVVTFLIALLEDDASYGPRRATTAFILLALGSILGAPLFGMITDRYGRTIGLTSSFIVMTLATGVIATGHRPGASIGAFVFGWAFAGVPISVAARITDHTAGDDFGAAYGVATLVFGVGLTIGPQASGWLADLTGSFRPAFVIVAGIAAAGAVIAGRIAPEMTGVGLDNP